MSAPLIRTKQELDIMLNEDFFDAGDWRVGGGGEGKGIRCPTEAFLEPISSPHLAVLVQPCAAYPLFLSSLTHLSWYSPLPP
jgi:hypothetical protein